jgi:hypothetical protein
MADRLRRRATAAHCDDEQQDTDDSDRRYARDAPASAQSHARTLAAGNRCSTAGAIRAGRCLNSTITPSLASAFRTPAASAGVFEAVRALNERYQLRELGQPVLEPELRQVRVIVPLAARWIV